MDKKQKKWRGRSPYIKKVLEKKNDPIGHWTTQVCVNLASTSEPYILGLYPFAGSLENGLPLETRTAIWQWLLALLKYYKNPTKLPIICADSFYLDNSSRQMLLDEKVYFHCSVKKNWFLPVTKSLEAKVKDMGQWAGAENETTGEVAIFTWSGEQDVGKKYLLTNLLDKQPGKQEKDNPPGWDVYKAMFNGCDRFNFQFSDFLWPYRHSHWTAHYHDIFLTHILLNSVALFRELHPKKNCGTTKSLLVTLAAELHGRCNWNDLPKSQW